MKKVKYFVFILIVSLFVTCKKEKIDEPVQKRKFFIDSLSLDKKNFYCQD